MATEDLAVTEIDKSGFDDRNARVNSAYKIKPSISRAVTNHRWLLTQAPVSSNVLEDIRKRARETWSSPDFSQTSYGHHFERKSLDEPTLLRPTSPTRRNNPHPPQVFLSCRLHYVPGFGNPDVTQGRLPHRVSGSFSATDQTDRFRGKYATRPSSAAINQFIPKSHVDDLLDSGCSDSNGNIETDLPMHEPRYFSDINAPPRTASLNRYLKYAGPSEKEFHLRALNQRPVTAGVYVERAQPGLTFDGRYRSLFRPTRARGDFSIHPDWPPTLPHHNFP